MKHIITILIIAVFSSCKEQPKKSTPQKESVNQQVLDAEDFKTTIDGKPVGLYWIGNNGIKAALTNYGGRLVGLWVNDSKGTPIDVVVGMSTIEAYQKAAEPYFGATIGRVGNRIAKGKFTLNGKQYNIPVNNGEHALHGGTKGFQDVVWKAKKTNENSITLSYISPHMEMGFPGTLNVNVTYSLLADKSLKITYQATTDKQTIVNLTNHAFFNLNGEGSGTILNHIAQFNASSYTPVDKSLIPTGKIVEVKGTPFDFTTPQTIGARITTNNQQLKNAGGYDHNFVINQANVKANENKKTNDLNHLGCLTGDQSGIVMNVYTTEPGFQFYSGNFMKGNNSFKTGKKDDFRTAFALETQHFPDSPNQPEFPSIILNPEDTYRSISIYKFSGKSMNK